MRIYLTGVAGMIGSNVAKALIEQGYEVIGVDNFWRGTKKNLNDLEGVPQFYFRHADISSDQDWFSDMTSSDVIIHTADVVAGIDYVFSNEWAVFQKNILINTQIARIANRIEPKHLIYLGTACSYPKGLQQSVEKSELSEALKFPADPESGYGWSKLMGEIEYRLAIKGTSTRLTVLDLHNVYGWPCVYSDKTAQVIPSLIFRALNSKDGKLTVWGNGQQGRAFINVSDVVDGVSAALSYSGTETALMLGPTSCTTILQLATLIQRHPQIKIDEIVFDTTKPVGDIGRFADITLAQRELSWSPKVEFQSGLYEVIDRIYEDIQRNS
jgi:GDP-D-mannose 3', 5'-epimerase